MVINKYIFCLALTVFSCKNNINKKVEDIEQVKAEDELNYVVNDFFPIGDVRRYGVKVDGGDPIHPYSNKSTYSTILDISENFGIELYFPKGYYREGLIIKGKNNVTINFNNAEFSGPIYIIEDENRKGSNNIKFKGNVITYTKFLTSYSSKIDIDSIRIKSNDTLSNYGKRSGGCDIFRGTNNLIIKSLIIDDLGSGSDDFISASAALMIHGWGANPKDVRINNVLIESSDRHGAYVTGEGIILDNLIINAYGLGEKKSMARMQDAGDGEEQNITGLWINNCNNSVFKKVEINTENSVGKYSIWLDSGDFGKPNIIEELKLIGGYDILPIYAEDMTNVVVKSVKLR